MNTSGLDPESWISTLIAVTTPTSLSALEISCLFYTMNAKYSKDLSLMLMLGYVVHMFMKVGCTKSAGT